MFGLFVYWKNQQNIEFWIFLWLLLLLLFYYFYIKYSLAPITAKDIKKEKENMHRPIHSKPGPIRSLFLLLLLLLLLYGPIRSRLAEHNKNVKLEKSIRSKLFSPIHTFSQSPLSSVITCVEMLAITNIMLCCYDWLEFCYVILLWWIFWLLMLEEWV